MRLAARIEALLGDDGRTTAERRTLARLVALFAELPRVPDPHAVFPHQDRLRERLLERVDHGDGEELEQAFLELYCHLHMHEAPYTPSERARVNATGGYWCHAGGVSPLLRAGPWLAPGSVLVDLGAGNGLQALLFQKLHPHARSVLVEISSRMASIGADLSAWLGIDARRIEWVVDDVRNVSVRGFDFVYLYRPLRPVGPGRRFYERLAQELDLAERPVTVFSVADCLRPLLSSRFRTLSSDGHLTCMRSEGTAVAADGAPPSPRQPPRSPPEPARVRR